MKSWTVTTQPPHSIQTELGKWGQASATLASVLQPLCSADWEPRTCTLSRAVNRPVTGSRSKGSFNCKTAPVFLGESRLCLSTLSAARALPGGTRLCQRGHTEHCDTQHWLAWGQEAVGTFSLQGQRGTYLFCSSFWVKHCFLPDSEVRYHVLWLCEVTANQR